MNNIILIGFKCSGKTTLGKKMAEETGRHFIDTDALIKVPFSPIDVFRRAERQVIFALQEFQNCIIATGGGTVLDPDNVVILKKMGKLYYLRVDKEELKRRIFSEPLPTFFDPARPEESFEEMYAEREGVYEAVADEILVNELDDIGVVF